MKSVDRIRSILVTSNRASGAVSKNATLLTYIRAVDVEISAYLVEPLH